MKLALILFVGSTVWLGVAVINLLAQGTRTLDANTVAGIVVIAAVWIGSALWLRRRFGGGGSCPCGCGRRVPMSKGGAARQYSTITSQLASLREIAAEARDDGLDTVPLSQLMSEGDGIRKLLADHIHRLANPRTHPDLLHVARDIKVWNEDIVAKIASLGRKP